MSHHRGILLAFFLALLAVCPAQASRYRPRIVNGVVGSSFPTTGALLVGTSAASASMQCSGTLIGCETFLTAAHCVCEGTGGQCQGGDAPDASDYFVYLQNAGVFAVTNVAVHADFDFPVGDVAVLKLGSMVTGVTPMPINTVGNPPYGSDAIIAGFGRTGGSNNTYGIKRYGSVTMSQCSSESNVTSVCFEFNAPLGSPGSNSNTCNGDSGGPLYVDLGGSTVVAGITSGGYRQDCLAGDEGYDANVYEYRNWITAQGGADVGATSCGALPAVGSEAVTVTPFSGSLESQGDARHSVVVPAGTTRLRIALNAEADADLYVRANVEPTTSSFDCKEAGAGGFAMCEFVSPAPATVHILVHQYSGSGTYQATATLFSSDCGDPLNAGQPCDDGNVCTATDVCGAGVCGGSAVADGTACNDGNNCTNPDQCVAGQCTSGELPSSNCHAPFAPPAGTLRMRRPSTGKPRLAWRWAKGEATTVADFGQPTISTAYDLCLYSQVGATSSLLMQNHVAAAGQCGKRTCWKPTRHGFRYSDRNAGNGPITYLDLHDGIDGRATVTVRGKGTALDLPSLPLDPSAQMTMQLSNGSSCWEAIYPVAVKNTATEYRSSP